MQLLLRFAWRSGLQRRFYDRHDRNIDGSTPTQATLLRPRIRCFTVVIRRFTISQWLWVISAWWNLSSSKLKKSEAKLDGKTRKPRELLGESGFILCIAPSLLSRVRRIEMKKSNHGYIQNRTSIYRCVTLTI